MANSKCRWECPEQWSEWSEWLAAGLHARNRWRLPVLLVGMSVCRRPSHRDHLAAGRRRQRRLPRLLLLPGSRRTQERIDCDAAVGAGAADLPLPERVLLVIDDSPTKRYGPKVEGADVHHNPTPGPADQPFLYGHVWVTISLAAAASAVGRAGVAAAGHAVRPPADHGHDSQVVAVGRDSPPSCNWRRGWWSGSFRS